MPLFRLPGVKLASCHRQGDRPCCTARPICHLVAKDQSPGGIRRPDGIGTRDATQALIHVWSTPIGSGWFGAVSNGTSFAQVAGAILGKQARGRTLMRMRSLTSRASLRYPVQGGTGASCLLDSRHRIWYGARGQDGFRDATREEERRRAPHLRGWCLLEAPANSGERAGGRSASTSPPGPRPFRTGTGQPEPTVLLMPTWLIVYSRHWDGNLTLLGSTPRGDAWSPWRAGHGYARWAEPLGQEQL